MMYFRKETRRATAPWTWKWFMTSSESMRQVRNSSFINIIFCVLIQRACALRALGLLLADGTPTGGRGEDFLSRQPDFFTETAVTSERKVEKSFPRWEINRHVEG